MSDVSLRLLLGPSEVDVEPAEAGGAPPASDAGESDAVRLREMVRDHFAFIWRSLRGLGVPASAADDAAQQVFLVASQKLGAIEPGRERAFLFGTALGVASNARRALGRRREVADHVFIDRSVDPEPNAEERLVERERRAVLDEVLAAMPDDPRVVFVLFVLERLETNEIAAILGIAPGTVASRLRRARELFHALSARVQARLAREGAR